jgi:hypothetical protein
LVVSSTNHENRQRPTTRTPAPARLK